MYANIDNLPALPSDKQYQLWALKGGVPIDLGVMDDSTLLQFQKSTRLAEAFAITIEKAGGSPTPTMTELIMLGKISL